MPDIGLTHPQFQVIQLCAAAHYALEGMAHLARHPRPRFALAAEVARRASLPASYLAKIFRRLAGRGLLTARRGPGGGYALARDPRHIRVLEIVGAVSEPALKPRRCLLGVSHCAEGRPCPAHETVMAAETSLRKSLDRLSLAGLAANS